MKTKRILGIDPGFGRMGYGIIEASGREWQSVTYGCIETASTTPFVDRLLEIRRAVTELIQRYQPTHAAVEELFFYKNVTTAIQVGQARGVILITLAEAKLPIQEFTPLEIKQALTNYGRAEKKQVQAMVQMLLRLPTQNLQDDAADALAIALTAAAHLGTTTHKNP